MDLDMRTLIILLAFGNLVSALPILLQPAALSERPRRAFLGARVAQTLSWALLAFRGHIPDLWSAHVGNGLLMLGFALEGIALTDVFPGWRWRQHLLLGIALVGMALFWSSGHQPRIWVVVASLTVALLCLSTAGLLLACDGRPRLALALSGVYLLCSFPMVIRGVTALDPGSGMVLLVKGPVQVAAFLPMFVLLVMGSLGFPLLMVERGQQLRQDLEARLAAVFALTPVGLLITRRSDGIIEACNPAFERLVGQSRKALTGHTVLDLGVVWEPGEREALRLALEADGRLEGREVVFRRPDGSLRRAELAAVPLEGPSGPLVLSALTDMTVRIETALERERLIQELQAALANVKTLGGLLPICAGCKKIRDDQGYWNQLEHYLSSHSGAAFTHGLCPDCAERYLQEEDEAP